MTKPKKQPIRSCTVCGTTANKQQLVRFVRNTEGSVFCDDKGRAPGRGAYICTQAQCFEQAQKKNRLARALKCNLSDDDYSRLQVEYLELCAKRNQAASEQSLPKTLAESTE